MNHSTNGQASQAQPAKVTCQHVTELIIDYVTGDMAPAVCVVFEAHLHRCSDCKTFLSTYRQTIHSTRTVRYEDIPAEMLNRMQLFLDEQDLETKGDRSPSVPNVTMPPCIRS